MSKTKILNITLIKVVLWGAIGFSTLALVYHIRWFIPFLEGKTAFVVPGSQLPFLWFVVQICSNVIFPGFMDSPITRLNSPRFREEVMENSCLKQLNQPEQAAEFIFYLANLDSVSGQVFNLDSRI